MDYFAQITRGYSGGDITELCQLASSLSIRDMISTEIEQAKSQVNEKVTLKNFLFLTFTLLVVIV